MNRLKARLRRTPLQVKLVAAVLMLVTAGLVVTGCTSAIAMHNYLVSRIDGQLAQTARRVDIATVLVQQDHLPVLPTDYLVGITTSEGRGVLLHDPSLSDAELPPLPATISDVLAHADRPYTVHSSGGARWRLLVTERPNGQIVVVGQIMSDVDSAVDRLVAIDVVVGGLVLVVLATLGVAIVRASLRPLVAIEHTAAAIAEGDLTRRVPESEPQTEVGRLAQAINAMLTQIEGAFTARAESERAARAAEASARDAAAAAQVSESRARRSEERMRQFIADASHELRTPLTSIRGFAELYRHGAARDPEQTAGLLRRIEDEADRMGLLVEDLLLLARLDRERPLVLAPVELRVVVSDALAAARAIAPERCIELELPEPARPVLVLGDEPRLRQVVGNLMTNALTHTPSGTPVTLRLCVERGMASVEVVDAGPGLTPEQADRVFERFYRIDKARTRRAAVRSGGPLSGHSGAGLGLAIVAALVAAHDGSVEVDSEPGAGATFRVRLPLLSEIDDDEALVLSASSQPEPSSAAGSPGTVEA